MKVAMYYPWIYLKGGPERTFIEIGRRSRNDWTFFTSHYDREGTFSELQGFEIVELPRISVKRNFTEVIRAGIAISRIKLDLDDYDALVVSCDGLGNFLNFRNASKPSICLCFTPLRAVYDHAYRARHLARYDKIRPLALLFETAFKLFDRAAWSRYDDVVCISETVRRRVIDGGLYSADSIGVCHPGVPADRIRVSEEREPFFFLPGRIMWTKNIELGIRAFKRFRQSGPAAAREFRLVVAGMVDAKSRSYYEDLRRLAADDEGITFIETPTDEQMQDLYRRCYGLLFTAFNEDWGLTPIEAMVHGKPVVAVASGGPCEVVVDGETGRLVPAEPEAFAEAMTALAADPEEARRMGEKGAERARLFTWEKFVSEFDDRLDAVVRRVGARGPRGAVAQA